MRSGKGVEVVQGKDRSRVRRLPHQDLTQETRREIVEFLKKCKVAATSLYDDVVLDTEECHE